VKIGRNSDFPLFSAISFNNTFTNAGLLGITAWNGSDTKLYLQHQGSGIDFRSSGTSQMLLNGNGNLLIGTSSETGLGSAGIKIAGTTAASNTATGSLINAGGFGNPGAAYFGGAVTVAGTVIHTLSSTPASASATGTVGTMSWDANYIYICTATNTWKRVAIATW